MKIEIEIKRLGGIRNLFPEKNTFLTSNLICDLESLFDCKLPDDFKFILQKYGICTFNNTIAFNAISGKAEYEHQVESNIISNVFKTSTIAVFLGANSRSYNIFDYISIYKNRIPNLCLPIATDGMGNLILLSLEKTKFGKIYFWDHENEWDEDDFEEDMGFSMPPEAKFQNIWLIGNTFNDFIERCYIYNL